MREARYTDFALMFQVLGVVCDVYMLSRRCCCNDSSEHADY